MAKSISYLSPGTKIIDSMGNTYIVLAQNHYKNGQTTVWTEACVTSMKMSSLTSGVLNYESTDVNSYLKNTYPNTLSDTIKRYTVDTEIPFTDIVSDSIQTQRFMTVKYFLLSEKELGNSNGFESNHKVISYLNNDKNREVGVHYWTRSERLSSNGGNVFAYISMYGYNHGYASSVNTTHSIRPAFNLSHELLVEDQLVNGYYRVIDSVPPKVSNINNLTGNYGSDTIINYEVINEEGHALTHYLSVDNGDSWQVIKPTKNGNNYSFKYVFNEIKTYYCRVKVVDTVNSVGTSNMFTVTLNHSVPNITILDHDNLDFRFRVNCVTSELTKIEIYVNDSLKKTITSNLDFTQTYSIDKTLLTNSKNYVQIKATAKSELVGTKDIEVRKTTHDVPVVGSKVVINDNVYTVEGSSKNDGVITLNLIESLVNKVSKGDLISILQDNVKVKCSLSNMESKLDYKDMKLVKVKTLKGDLAGYIEEKYILEGEGRYSSIKLELEKFNSSVDVGVKELQQMFDYLED